MVADAPRADRYIMLTMVFRPEDDRVVAECVELGTSTFGRTFEEAEERLKEAVTLHLETLEDEGELERFLDEQGVRVFTGPTPHFTTLRPVHLKPAHSH